MLHPSQVTDMSKEKMLVEAICDGTVLDHIPSDKLFKIVSLLGLEHCPTPVTIGNNLDSKRQGKKGIIKISAHFFSPEEISRIAILSPDIQHNVIRDYKVVEKSRLPLPSEVIGIVRCSNPKCITNNEPMPTRMAVSLSPQAVSLECHYCGRKTTGDEAQLL